MKTTSRGILALTVIAIAAAAAYVGYLYGDEHAAQKTVKTEAAEKAPAEGGKEDEESSVEAKVKTAEAQMADVAENVWAYGSVVAEPEEIQTVSLPFECVVRRVLVIPGQAVAAGVNLVEVEPSPGALSQLQEAKATCEAAGKELAQVQQKAEMKLATSTELNQAQQALTLAQLKLESLEKQDIRARKIPAPQAGIVNKIAFQEGQTVPSGGALAEVVPENRIEVKLSVEPTDAARLKVNQLVMLTAVDGKGKPTEGHLRLVARRVNPSSRMVDAFVSLPPESGLLLETYVRARITVASRQALVVPRSAVLPEEDKHVLFTVKDGKAVRHVVSIGLQDDKQVELLGEEIKSGDEVVIQGNYELQDGMAVVTDEAESQPSESHASQSQPAESQP